MEWRSTGTRLALWTLLGSALVMLASGGLMFSRTRDALLQQTHREASALTSAGANAIQARLDRVVVATRQLAALTTTHPEQSEQLLRDVMGANPDLAGLTIVLRPGADGVPPPAPFVSRRADGRLAVRDLRADATRYWEQNWFLGGLTCRRGCWQRPFYSRSRQRWLINYSVAIVRHEQAIGLVNADVTLAWLQQVMERLHTMPGARAFVIRSDGHFLASGQASRVGQRAAPALLAALARPPGRPHLLEAAVGTDRDERAWVYGAPIQGTRWTLGLLVPEGRIYASIRQVFTANLTVGMLALLGVALIILLVTRSTLAPLGVLADRAEHVARGELDFALPPIRRHDEIGRLTGAFDDMRRRLADHIEQLTRAARAQQRLTSQLEIAQQIQTSMLPAEHYLEAQGHSFELHAVLRPARTVGGDLYSYFMLDARHFCVMVGDVSDKGIPASLFMARTTTLAKALAPHTLTPQDLLQRLNRELCVGNESCMFVTLLCGVLDIGSGRLMLASAGHDPAILCGEDGASLVDVETGPAIGLDEDAEYPGHCLQLQPGQSVVMYTDGITEAQSESGALYGVERTLAALGGDTAAAPECTSRLLDDVGRFVGSAAQADDITVLAMKWHHARSDDPSDMLELTLPNRIGDVFAALDRCESALARAGVETGVREDVRLVLEELMVNMVEHGHECEGDGTIRLHLHCDASAVQVELHDDGRPFDPLQAPAPTLSGDVADNERIGGLGVHLVRALASHLDYAHDAQGNHLQLRFVHTPQRSPNDDA